MTYEIHKLFNELKRYSYPFTNEEKIHDGLFTFFEKGERYKKMDRIVMIGSHSGTGNLFERLKEHYIKENKDRSIFRKHIGRCIVNREQSNYLKYWNIDKTLKKNREKRFPTLYSEFEKEVERRISDHVRGNVTFAILPFSCKTDRKFWKAKIASTLHRDNLFTASDGWLGNISPDPKIRESRLWQVNDLNETPIHKEEFDDLVKIIFNDLSFTPTV